MKQGATRNVFLTKRYAIKLPRWSEWRLFLQGLLANMQERVFWTTEWPELCPVVWSLSGGWIVVMARAKELTRNEWNEFDAEQWRDREEYTIPVENKRDSFGWFQGRIVAIDYGT